MVGIGVFELVSGGGRSPGSCPARSSATVPEDDMEIRVVSGEVSEQSLQISNKGVIGEPGLSASTQP